MTLQMYRNPKAVGWMGWIEDAGGVALGFVRPDGRIVWCWDPAW